MRSRINYSITVLLLAFAIQLCNTSGGIFVSPDPQPLLSRVNLDKIYVQKVQAVDIDQDGDLDLVVADLYNFLLLGENNGNGNFTWHSYSIGENINGHGGLSLADLNGDGVLDIFYAWRPNYLSELTSPVVMMSQMNSTSFEWEYNMIFLDNTISAEQMAEYGSYQDVQIFQQADVTYLAYFTAQYSNPSKGIFGPGGFFLRRLEVTWGGKDAGLSEPTLVSAVNHPTGIFKVVDLDNDGYLDILIGTATTRYAPLNIESEIQVFWGNSSGVDGESNQLYYASTSDSDEVIQMRHLNIADVDGDGLLDFRSLAGTLHPCSTIKAEDSLFRENRVECEQADREPCGILGIDVMDVEGHQEIVFMSGKSMFYYAADGLVRFGEFSSGVGGKAGILADFDGDGLKEFIFGSEKTVNSFETAYEYPTMGTNFPLL